VGETSLRRVFFASVLSLWGMIETGAVALQEDFVIQFIDCDGPLNFSGYFLETVHDASDVFHFVED
jgi:hypothetical protein